MSIRTRLRGGKRGVTDVPRTNSSHSRNADALVFLSSVSSSRRDSVYPDILLFLLRSTGCWVLWSVETMLLWLHSLLALH